MKKFTNTVLPGTLAVLFFGAVLSGYGQVSVLSLDVGSLAPARTEIAFTGANSLSGELQWLAVQTACLGIYNMAQTGNYVINDPYDYYQPNNIRKYLTSLSGNETKNTMFYGICFNYAQAAYDDISKYRSHYEKLGMKKGGWYIAVAKDSSREILLYDPVSPEKATERLNGVNIKENSRYTVRAHGGATWHAWLWVYGNDGTIYWIDPTWTDNAGYVWWGIVKNGEEIQVRPSESLCMVRLSSDDSSLAALNRGNASKNQGDYDQAIADYTEALRIDPNFVVAYNNRGYAYSKKNLYDRAIEDYTAAMRIDPNYAIGYNNRGEAYRVKGDYDRAIEDYTAALRIDPNYVFAYNNRGYAYSNKGLYDRAIEDCNAALRIDPNLASAYNNRAYAYYNKKDYRRARADLEKALHLDPDYTDAREGLEWLRGMGY